MCFQRSHKNFKSKSKRPKNLNNNKKAITYLSSAYPMPSTVLIFKTTLQGHFTDDSLAKHLKYRMTHQKVIFPQHQLTVFPPWAQQQAK